MSIVSSPTTISLGNRPCTLSYFIRCAAFSIEPGELILVTRMSLRVLVAMCASVQRPIRPSPLIPMLMLIACLRIAFACPAA